jgi:Fe-S cluster assembly ATP-binding protein
MKKILLKIQDLEAKSGEKVILKGLNLEIAEGETHALLGPNASGKSTLAKVLLGNPKYKVTKGRIIFAGKDITKLPPEKRVKLGLALAWQAPPAIKGLKLSDLLGKISKDRSAFVSELWRGEGSNLLNREVNVDFSGGEKKISELLQILAQKPKLVVFDEIDSGLDIIKLEMVAKIIVKEFIKKGIAILVITHSGQILDFLKPKKVNVLIDGRISRGEDNYKTVLATIKKYGYEKCKNCKNIV